MGVYSKETEHGEYLDYQLNKRYKKIELQQLQHMIHDSIKNIVWQNQPLGGSTSLVSVRSISAYTDQSTWSVAIAFGWRL